MQGLCINGEILGIVTIRHQAGGMGQKLQVVFLAEKRVGRPNLGAPSCPVKGLTMEELKSLSNFVLDVWVLKLLQLVESGGGRYPTSLLECVDMKGRRRGTAGRRRESELADRPELQRGASLEEQMLAQAGYGEYG